MSSNNPDRYDLYVLAPGEQKLKVEEDTKIPNAATITILKEDHTLANALRSQLLHDPRVLFAGYQVPHPLTPSIVLKVQTTDETTPIQAVWAACQELVLNLAKLKTAWAKEVPLAKARQSGMEMEGGLGDGEYDI